MNVEEMRKIVLFKLEIIQLEIPRIVNNFLLATFSNVFRQICV